MARTYWITSRSSKAAHSHCRKASTEEATPEPTGGRGPGGG